MNITKPITSLNVGDKISLVPETKYCWALEKKSHKVFYSEESDCDEVYQVVKVGQNSISTRNISSGKRGIIRFVKSRKTNTNSLQYYNSIFEIINQ